MGEGRNKNGDKESTTRRRERKIERAEIRWEEGGMYVYRVLGIIAMRISLLVAKPTWGWYYA